jgi:hypothetical protein
MIILIKTGATRTVTKGMNKNLEATPGKHSVGSLQKTAVLGTSHIIRKVLQSERWGSQVVEEEKYQEGNTFDKRLTGQCTHTSVSTNVKVQEI